MAKKKSGNVVFVFLAILLIIGIFFVAKDNIFTQSFEGGGTILSIDKIEVTSSVAELDFQEAYLIDFVVNKGAESISAEITPETFKQFGVSDDKIPKGPFKIDISLVENFCDYQIVDDSFTAPVIYQASGRHGLAGNCGDGLNVDCPYSSVDLQDVIDNCKGTYKRPDYWANQGTLLDSKGKLTKNTCNDVSTNPNCQGTVHSPEFCGKDFEPGGTESPIIGAAPNLGIDVCDSIIDLQATPQFNSEQSEWCYSAPNEILKPFDDDHWRVTHLGQFPLYQGFRVDDTSFNKFKIKVTLTNGEGEEFITEINDNKQIDIIQGVMRTKFVGSLVGIQSCPAPYTNTAIIKDLTTQEFKEVDKNDYDGSKDQVFELVNLDNNFFSSSNTDPGVGFSDITSRVSTANARVTAMYNEDDFRKDCKIENDTLQYRCTPQNDVIYPEIQVIIKAETIGLVLPSGIPKIKSIDVPEAFEGDINKLGFTIENEADEDDTFNVYADCGTSDIDVASIKVPVAAGESVDGELLVNAQVGEVTCLLKAQSLNNPFNVDSQEFTIEFKQKELTFEKPQPFFGQGFGNFPSYLIWVIVAILIIVIGSLLYINRKKVFKIKRR